MSIPKMKKIADFYSKASNSLMDGVISEEFEQNPTFFHISSPTNWSQPTAISIMIATILCESEGIDISAQIADTDIFAKFKTFVSSNKSLGQTQADGQWRYYAKIISEFCTVFGLTKDTFQDKESLFGGYNLLEYFYSIPLVKN
jgi:hypothetical protein